MKEHDPRCEGHNDQKTLDDVANYGWHVTMVLDSDKCPAWAYSIGLYRNFGHPEITIFGLDIKMMHLIINDMGEEIRAGKTFEPDVKYSDILETYPCVVKPVNSVWYKSFLGGARWFYEGSEFPVLQCFWPDFDGRFPWETGFKEDLVWAQPLLFHDDAVKARATELLKL